MTRNGFLAIQQTIALLLRRGPGVMVAERNKTKRKKEWRSL